MTDEIDDHDDPYVMYIEAYGTHTTSEMAAFRPHLGTFDAQHHGTLSKLGSLPFCHFPLGGPLCVPADVLDHFDDPPTDGESVRLGRLKSALVSWIAKQSEPMMATISDALTEMIRATEPVVDAIATFGEHSSMRLAYEDDAETWETDFATEDTDR